MPILSFFRTYNVISVHCEPRKGVDRQVVEKHTAKQTQHGMCLKKAKTAKKKKIYIYKQCTDTYYHIFLHYSTVLKGSGSWCTREKTSFILSGLKWTPPVDRASVSVTSLLFICCSFPTHKKQMWIQEYIRQTKIDRHKNKHKNSWVSHLCSWVLWEIEENLG